MSVQEYTFYVQDLEVSAFPDKEGTTLSIKPGYYGGFNTLLQEMNMALEKVQKAGLKCCPIREAV